MPSWRGYASDWLFVEDVGVGLTVAELCVVVRTCVPVTWFSSRLVCSGTEPQIWRIHRLDSRIADALGLSVPGRIEMSVRRHVGCKYGKYVIYSVRGWAKWWK